MSAFFSIYCADFDRHAIFPAVDVDACEIGMLADEPCALGVASIDANLAKQTLFNRQNIQTKKDEIPALLVG